MHRGKRKGARDGAKRSGLNQGGPGGEKSFFGKHDGGRITPPFRKEKQNGETIKTIKGKEGLPNPRRAAYR